MTALPASSSPVRPPAGLPGAATPARTPRGHGASTPAVLKRCRELVRPVLAEAVGRLHPWPGEMAAYALGWADTAGTPALGGSEGKGVRQALAVLGAEAVGADGAAAVPGAVAVELVHTFSLLHDDIMDADALRRRRPAVWKAYGTGPAVLAGDALHAQAVAGLAEARNPHAAAAVRCLCRTLNALVTGQAEDLRFEERPWSGPGSVVPGEYRSMAEHKTGALLGGAIALGAVLGGAPDRTVTALERAGRHLGLAFQAVDDLLGIWGDPAETGKPVHADLRRGKKTYPVLAALAGGGTAARELETRLGSARRIDGETAARLATLVEEAGGRTAAREEARRQLDTARRALRAAPLAHTAAQELDTLFTHLLDRTW
ncbi:polyprenyl synthetase family protein [Streptomyces sp. ms191]|uniref:polyprenyl synthetase family protein n=1 Tax=Streptomyces sp. ms191 TaxID=1827978 RepID=UPI0011CD614A|nr:polyprenyl synthetase family protein [Streptomyces sp. ms191]TXS33590.1 polyprenyl synthetase family protein [Streptomyces sp. ms191]